MSFISSPGDGRQALVKILSIIINRPITIDNVIFGLPQRATGSNPVRNTFINLTFKQETGFYGSVNIQYNRIHINNLPTITIDRLGATTYHEVIPTINSVYNLGLTINDIVNGPLPNLNNNITITLPISNNSLMFYKDAVINTSGFEPNYSIGSISDTLLEYICVGTDQYGVFSDNQNNVYQKLTEQNSFNCGFINTNPHIRLTSPAQLNTLEDTNSSLFTLTYVNPDLPVTVNLVTEINSTQSVFNLTAASPVATFRLFYNLPGTYQVSFNNNLDIDNPNSFNFEIIDNYNTSYSVTPPTNLSIFKESISQVFTITGIAVDPDEPITISIQPSVGLTSNKQEVVLTNISSTETFTLTSDTPGLYSVDFSNDRGLTDTNTINFTVYEIPQLNIVLPEEPLIAGISSGFFTISIEDPAFDIVVTPQLNVGGTITPSSFILGPNNLNGNFSINTEYVGNIELSITNDSNAINPIDQNLTILTKPTISINGPNDFVMDVGVSSVDFSVSILNAVNDVNVVLTSFPTGLSIVPNNFVLNSVNNSQNIVISSATENNYTLIANNNRSLDVVEFTNIVIAPQSVVLRTPSSLIIPQETVSDYFVLELINPSNSVSVTITLSNGLEIYQSPLVVNLSPADPEHVFQIRTLNNVSIQTITISNDHELPNPQPVNLNIINGSITVIEPVGTINLNQESGYFTISLNNFGGSTEVTLNSNLTVDFIIDEDHIVDSNKLVLNSSNDSASFRIVPREIGSLYIGITNNKGLTFLGSLEYEVVDIVPDYDVVLKTSPNTTWMPYFDVKYEIIARNEQAYFYVLASSSEINGNSLAINPVGTSVEPGSFEFVLITNGSYEGNYTITFTNQDGLIDPPPIQHNIVNTPSIFINGNYSYDGSFGSSNQNYNLEVDGADRTGYFTIYDFYYNYGINITRPYPITVTIGNSVGCFVTEDGLTPITSIVLNNQQQLSEFYIKFTQLGQQTVTLTLDKSMPWHNSIINFGDGHVTQSSVLSMSFIVQEPPILIPKLFLNYYANTPVYENTQSDNFIITKENITADVNIEPVVLSESFEEPLSDFVVLDLKFQRRSVDNSIIDSSNKFTVTKTGSVYYDNYQSMYGSTDISFDSTGSWLTITGDMNNFKFNADFCIEISFKTTSLNKVLIDCYHPSRNTSWSVYITPSGNLQFYTGLVTFTSSITVNDGSLKEASFSRIGSQYLMVINNQIVHKSVNTIYNFDSVVVTNLYIGAQVFSRNSDYDFVGKIGRVRITKGASRYFDLVDDTKIEYEKPIVAAFEPKSIYMLAGQNERFFTVTFPVRGTFVIGINNYSDIESPNPITLNIVKQTLPPVVELIAPSSNVFAYPDTTPVFKLRLTDLNASVTYRIQPNADRTIQFITSGIINGDEYFVLDNNRSEVEFVFNQYPYSTNPLPQSFNDILRIVTDDPYPDIEYEFTMVYENLQTTLTLPTNLTYSVGDQNVPVLFTVNGLIREFACYVFAMTLDGKIVDDTSVALSENHFKVTPQQPTKEILIDFLKFGAYEIVVYIQPLGNPYSGYVTYPLKTSSRPPATNDAGRFIVLEDIDYSDRDYDILLPSHDLLPYYNFNFQVQIKQELQNQTLSIAPALSGQSSIQLWSQTGPYPFRLGLLSKNVSGVVSLSSTNNQSLINPPNKDVSFINRQHIVLGTANTGGPAFKNDSGPDLFYNADAVEYNTRNISAGYYIAFNSFVEGSIPTGITFPITINITTSSGCLCYVQDLNSGQPAIQSNSITLTSGNANWYLYFVFTSNGEKTVIIEPPSGIGIVNMVGSIAEDFKTEPVILKFYPGPFETFIVNQDYNLVSPQEDTYIVGFNSKKYSLELIDLTKTITINFPTIPGVNFISNFNIVSQLTLNSLNPTRTFEISSNQTGVFNFSLTNNLGSINPQEKTISFIEKPPYIHVEGNSNSYWNTVNNIPFNITDKNLSYELNIYDYQCYSEDLGLSIPFPVQLNINLPDGVEIINQYEPETVLPTTFNLTSCYTLQFSFRFLTPGTKNIVLTLNKPIPFILDGAVTSTLQLTYFVDGDTGGGGSGPGGGPGPDF